MNFNRRWMGCALAVVLAGCLVPVDAGNNDGGSAGGGSAGGGSAGGGSAGGGSAGGGSAGGGSAGGGSAGGGSAGGGSVLSGPCTIGQDQTCNDDPAQSSLAGKCLAFVEHGVGGYTFCQCNPGFSLKMSGRCAPVASTGCGAVGTFTTCKPAGALTNQGLCAPDDTCFCSQGFVRDSASGHCVNPTPGCVQGGPAACNGNPAMSAPAGVCTLLGGADGCDCVDGYDSRETSGKCFGAGRDGGVVEYALKPLATGLDRVLIQRDDPASGHCAVIGLVRPVGSTAFPRIIITGATTARPVLPDAGGAPPPLPEWKVEHVTYAAAPCNAPGFSDVATARVGASFADGTIHFNSSTSASVNVNVFFPQMGTQPIAPMKLRFIADQVVLPLP